MKEVTIIVAGKTASGKSTVAQIIAKALSDNGIKNRLVDDEALSFAKIQDRIKPVAEKAEVLIKTVQVNRQLEPST